MRFIAKLLLAGFSSLAAVSGDAGTAVADGHSVDRHRAYGQHNRVASGDVPERISSGEVIEAGHQFFGTLSGGIATFIETVYAKHGEPNGYVLGQEGSGAFIAGARYGEGTLHTRNAGVHQVYWQGPSIGLDFGASGTRVMMLVYNLPSVEAIYQQYNGVDSSAFLVGGVGMTMLENSGTYVVPVKSGIGARLGVNLGYMKFTEKPTWNPF